MRRVLGIILLLAVLLPAVHAQDATRSAQSCTGISTTEAKHVETVNAAVAALLDKGDSVVARVDAFYQSHVIAAGHSVVGYAALKANVETKKAAVNAALTAVHTAVETMPCTPGLHKLKSQNLLQAVTNYRVALQTLILSVHRVAPN